jgi:hypothetical protein
MADIGRAGRGRFVERQRQRIGQFSQMKVVDP